MLAFFKTGSGNKETHANAGGREREREKQNSAGGRIRKGGIAEGKLAGTRKQELKNMEPDGGGGAAS